MKGVKCVDCAEYNWDLLWCENVVDSPYTEMERECRYYHEKDRDVVKVIRCKDCIHKTVCFSEVAMTNEYQTTTLYEPIEWCSKGEREES